MTFSHRNRSVDPHQFAMVPNAEIPRSRFDRQFAHKTTFDAGFLVPVYVDEVIPGDSFHLKMTAFARIATPIVPVMDNMFLDSFFFFVPNRLVWDNWKRFMGEKYVPTDTTVYAIPQHVSPGDGYPVGSLQDYMGLPTKGQLLANKTVYHSALFLRAYNLIWNEWFRDENIQTPALVAKTDGPDLNPTDNYFLRRRGKRHDYFTGCLPWPQKGDPVTIPLGTEAPVIRYNNAPSWTAYQIGTNDVAAAGAYLGTKDPGKLVEFSKNIQLSFDPNGSLYADLTHATAATINQLRQSFQIQKLLERDARGGTRYTEIVRAHFGVVSPDARLQRPEYLGGGSSPIIISPIAQTAGTGSSGTTTPLGNLAGVGTILAKGHGFNQSFTEHGMIIGLVNVRADLTYQQGLHRMWSRVSRYDFYFPAFAMLGEQAVLNGELFYEGSDDDKQVFGYQERWAEMRYKPSMITGKFRSTSQETIDYWHLAQKFSERPKLNSTFIEDAPPLSRVIAAGVKANGQQIIFDSFFDCVTARPMPMYSVPGLIDHF